MNGRRLTSIFIIIAAIGAIAFYFKRYKVPPQIELPYMVLTDVNGKNVKLDQYAGEPALISFFATWCGPCIHELPELAEVGTRLSEHKLHIICITDEPTEKFRELATGFEGQILFLHSARNLHSLGIYSYPTNYIFDKKGKQIYQKVGADNWEDPAMIAKLSQMLGQ